MKAKLAKLIEKLETQPDSLLSEVESLLRAYDYFLEKKQKGSKRVYKHSSGKYERIKIKMKPRGRNRVKRWYIKDATDILRKCNLLKEDY